MAREQDQFLRVVDRDEAERRWWSAIDPRPLGAESVPIGEALGRILAADVVARIDVPPFDRSLVDGYAVRSEGTFGASEDRPRHLILAVEEITPGDVPNVEVAPGRAISIATGSMMPRGADAVLMVEHARIDGDELVVQRPVPPGAHVGFAGADMARGETVLRRGTPLTARETGVLAALGDGRVEVFRRPRVAILSTGDELLAPGGPIRPAGIYDANATMLADAVRELGGSPIPLGIVPDDDRLLEAALASALEQADMVVLSGGTSKGAGDQSYRALQRRTPGVIVHGVALKPGKPICLGAVGKTPVVVLPGFPTSAIFTFHELVAPVIRRLSGGPAEARGTVQADLAVRCNSDRGRTEAVLVGLVPRDEGLAAYPIGKGSGSVTAFSRADGFVTIPKSREFADRGERVTVTLLSNRIEPAELVAIGSHCIGLDALLGRLNDRGIRSKVLWIGSQGGLDAVDRGEADLAGIHLLDPESDAYNAPFLPDGIRLLPGYGRMQGLVYRIDDDRLKSGTIAERINRACADPSCLMVNRNRGSGTRILIDGLLEGRRPPGWPVEVRSHNAVAAAVEQGRADWGVAIEPVARAAGLGFEPIREERYDFAIADGRWDRPPLAAFRALLDEPEARRMIAELGFRIDARQP